MASDRCQRGRWGMGGIAWPRVLGVLLSGVMGASASGQTDATPGGDMVFARKGSGSPVTDGHGWMVARESIAGTASRAVARLVLEHLPPRLGDTGDLSGVVRRVISMEAAGGTRGTEGGLWEVSGDGGIDGIAWKKNRVYLLMPEERVGAASATGLGRRVLMVSAVHAAGTLYEYSPSGRAAVRATLPSPAGGSVIVGFAALAGSPPHDGVCALVVPTLGQQDGELRGTEFWVMSGENWTRANAPWDGVVGQGWVAPPRWTVSVSGSGTDIQPAGRGTVQLLEWRDGVAITTRDASGTVLDVWIGSMMDSKAADGAPRIMEWRRETYPLGVDGAAELARKPIRLAFIMGQNPSGDVLVGWTSEASDRGQRKLLALRQTGPVLIASLAGVPPEADMIPMAAPGDGLNPAGRVAMVWNIQSAERANRVAVREYSAATGLLLFDGAARVDQFAERRRWQFAGIIVLLGSVGLMMVALRSRIESGIATAVTGVLPAGRGGRGTGRLRAADPLRRLGAAALDYAPSAVVVALAQGRDAVALLVPSTMFGGAAGLSADLDLGPFAIALGLTVLHTTVMEWAMGRSVGKFILGVRVVDARRSGGESGGVFVRPSLWQTFLRNTVRWCAPLLAVLALLDEAGRHPGDLAGQTIVVADPNDGS